MRHTLTICNVATSAMVRECQLAYITRAGVEIGVASTKAFTTQLAGLFLLTLALAQDARPPDDAEQRQPPEAMRHLPVAVQAVLALEPQIIGWAKTLPHGKRPVPGPGLHYPIALEGALKLKKSATSTPRPTRRRTQARPAGAGDQREMPVVTVAPNDALLEKLKSNMQEVRARGGELYVLADADTRIESSEGVHVIRMPDLLLYKKRSR